MYFFKLSGSLHLLRILLWLCLPISLEAHAASTKRRAIVQVGPEKTGSTSLQHDLSLFREQLFHRGWYLLDHCNFKTRCVQGNDTRYKEYCEPQWEKIRTGSLNILWACQFLSQDHQQVRQIFPSDAFDVDIVFMLRDPLRQLISQWSQLTKNPWRSPRQSTPSRLLEFIVQLAPHHVEEEGRLAQQWTQLFRRTRLISMDGLFAVGGSLAKVIILDMVGLKVEFIPSHFNERPSLLFLDMMDKIRDTTKMFGCDLRTPKSFAFDLVDFPVWCERLDALDEVFLAWRANFWQNVTIEYDDGWLESRETPTACFLNEFDSTWNASLWLKVVAENTNCIEQLRTAETPSDSLAQPGLPSSQSLLQSTSMESIVLRLEEKLEYIECRQHSSCFRRLPPMVQDDRRNLMPLRQIRPVANLTWEGVFDSVTAGGHPWCSLVRDNHACAGLRYVDVLRKVPLFRGERYGLHAFAAGTRILAVGNSHMLELFYAPICAAGKFGAQGFWNFGNSLLVMSPSTTNFASRAGVILLLLDNDVHFELPSVIVNLLNGTGFHPTHVLLGKLNDGQISREQEADEYARIYPDAIIMTSYAENRTFAVLPRNCKAEFSNCGVGGGHQCFPGPILQYSEEMMSALLLQSNSTAQLESH